jgi:hypothetical protein
VAGAQLRGGADAGEAGADDEDVDVLGSAHASTVAEMRRC